MKKSFICLFLQGILLLSCLLLWTCQEDNSSGGNSPELSETTLEISFNVSSVLSDLPEVRSEDIPDIVRNLSIFIFDHATGTKEFAYYLDFNNLVSSHEVDVSRWNEQRIISIAYAGILNTISQKRDIHVVANSENFLDNIVVASDLKKEITSPITHEIKYEEVGYYMHGEVNGHNFEEKFRAEVMLRRNVARAELTINTLDIDNVISFLPDNSIARIRVINVADRSFIVEQKRIIEGIHFIAYEEEGVSNKVVKGNKSMSKGVFYINENYIPEEAENPYYHATAVVIQISFKNEVTQEVHENNYYKLYINKELYSIERNTIYRIKVNIHTLGGETDLSAPVIEADVEVITWSDEVIDTDLT